MILMELTVRLTVRLLNPKEFAEKAMLQCNLKMSAESVPAEKNFQLTRPWICVYLFVYYFAIVNY